MTSITQVAEGSKSILRKRIWLGAEAPLWLRRPAGAPVAHFSRWVPYSPFRPRIRRRPMPVHSRRKTSRWRRISILWMSANRSCGAGP